MTENTIKPIPSVTGEIIDEVIPVQPKHYVVKPDLLELTTEVGVVKTTPQLVESSTFNDTLAAIPDKVELVNTLLSEYRADPDQFVMTHDESELDEALKEMKEITAFAKTIENNRKDIKNYMNSMRDDMLSYLDIRLADAQYDALVDAQSDIAQLKKDILVQRMNQRWAELEPLFTGSLVHYPLIDLYAPSLKDFSKFKLIHSKMVSGAKTKNVTAAMRKDVTNIVNEWNAALEMIQMNAWGLSQQKLQMLISQFVAAPSLTLVSQQGPALKIAQDAEEEAQRQLQEKQAEAERLRKIEAQRQADELARIKAEAERAQQVNDVQAKKDAAQKEADLAEQVRLAKIEEDRRQAEIEQLRDSYRPIVRESYPQVVDYLLSVPQYRDLHSNAKTKAAALYDLVTQMSNPNSVVMHETGGQPEKFLEMIRFVLDA